MMIFDLKLWEKPTRRAIADRFNHLGSAQKLLECFPLALRKHVVLAFCRQNVQSFGDFCGQLMPSYFCTIPYWKFGLREISDSKIKADAFLPFLFNSMRVRNDTENILRKTWGRSKTTECFFHKFGNMNGSSIFQIWANDLNADR